MLTKLGFRVNILQSLWRDTNGYLIHPAIDTKKRLLKVADVATATGYCTTPLVHWEEKLTAQQTLAL